MHAYIAVIALKDSSSVQDLLAYASIIVKGSTSYEGRAWLSYNSHFRSHTSANAVAEWGTIRPDLWTQYFSRATAKMSTLTKTDSKSVQRSGAGQQNTNKALNTNQRSSCASQRSQPYSKPPTICRRWNSATCREPSCSFHVTATTKSYIALSLEGDNNASKQASQEMGAGTGRTAVATQGDLCS